MVIDDVSRAGPLADALIVRLADVDPNVACAALAITLGQIAARHGVPRTTLQLLLNSAFVESEKLFAEGG
jgi:hypothetical protein